MLATYAFDNLGNRTSVTFGNGATQAFTYDPVSRLASLTNDLSGTANDLSASFAYSAAGQITQTVRTGDAYAWTGHGNGSTAYGSNGLNQQVTVGGATATWDSKGNLTSEPQSAKTYGYSSQNQLTSASGGVTLTYDPAMRLYQTSATTTARFLYDGLDPVAEYTGTNALRAKFVFDPDGQPIVEYQGTGTANRRFLGADERGSVISQTDSTGALLGIDAYDEYGQPGAANIGRFQYTGQMWLPEAGVYDYKARDYVPQLGVFAQADPIGYDAGANLYAYVLGDPVNLVDPFGLCGGPSYTDANGSIVVTGCKIVNAPIESNPRLQRLTSPGDRNGGDRRKDRREPRPGRRQTTCQVAAQEPGRIAFSGVSGTIADLFGVTGGFGKFVNLRTGTTGYYVTGGSAVGEEVAASGGGGVSSSMNSFLGLSANVSGAGGGVSGTASFNSGGSSANASASLGAGAAATVSYTTILGCKPGG